MSLRFLLALLWALTLSGAVHGSAVSYNFTGPVDAKTGKPIATDTIVGFDLDLTVLGSRKGKNNEPGLPSVGTKAGISIVPGKYELVPNTNDGLDPKTMMDPRFDFDDAVFVKAISAYSTKPNPGGATLRRDAARLAWTKPGKEFEFGQGYQLNFGADIVADNQAFAREIKLQDAFWTLDDKTTTIPAGQKALHGIKMGMNKTALEDGDETQGLFFWYTNDTLIDVTLSGLRFETRGDELPLSRLGPTLALGGHTLFDPEVSLNDLVISPLAEYTVPGQSTLKFRFAETTDYFFTVQGSVYAADGVKQLDFAFEDRVLPEPPGWILLGSAVLIATGVRRRSQKRMAAPTT